MVTKCLSYNKLSVGFLVLICMLFVYKNFQVHSQDIFPIFINNSEDYADINTSKIKGKCIAEIREIINRRNANPGVANDIPYNAIKRDYLAVIVVVVRSNPFFFENLIRSLQAVAGIRRTLLIFSHQIYDDHINDIVKNITFSKYVQIFYPHSIQLHPKVFPGDDPKLCFNKTNCEENNGRRNASIAQNKNHWLWTVNFVFEHLKPIEQYNKTVVFLEEDQCVAKDLIYILNIFEYAQPSVCPYCTIFSLAVLKPNVTKYYLKPAVITIRKVGSTQELMGIGFNRTVWYEIKKLSDYFCNFNDADWTRSVTYSLIKAPSRAHSILSINEPRVFRFDICPSYFCGDLEKVEMKQALMSKIENGLIPKRTVFRPYNKGVMLNFGKGHGDWNDSRDRVLCKDFTRTTRHR